MSTCPCEDEYDITCKVCSTIWIMEVQCKKHTEEHHGSSLKPPAEENDDKHEEEVDKASTDEEHKNDSALFEEAMTPTISNEEIKTYSVLSKAVYNYLGEVESPDVNESWLN